MDREIKQELMDEAMLHLYPGTQMIMQPGDVLYSHKTALSSFLVGHTAIVGINFRMYHVNRWAPFGHADSMPIYLSRHKKGEKLTILRHVHPEEAKKAAAWAMQQYDQIKQYTYTRDLQQLEKNYCSKFTWQAFYYGNEEMVDLLQLPQHKKKSWIMPGTLYHQFQQIGHFENSLHT